MASAALAVRRVEQRRTGAEEIRHRRDRYRNQDRQHHALQRPASAYGIIAKTEAAYFKKINDAGGINGRKINFISYDDAYRRRRQSSRPASWSRATRCCSSSIARHAANSAIQKYMNPKKVPQIFVASGATKWNDPKDFPWTMGWQPNYQSEGRSMPSTS